MSLRADVSILSSPDLSDTSVSLQPAKPDWETYCYHVADMIVQEQTPKRVMEVRAKLYELLSHCIPPNVVLKVRMPYQLIENHLIYSVRIDNRGTGNGQSRRGD